MRAVRLIPLGLLVVVLAACSGKSTDTGDGGGSGKGKGDGESAKLVGTWEVTEGADKGLTLDFMKDGKLKSSIAGLFMEGTYSVDGKKLTITMNNHEGKNTIEKLTEGELVFKDEEGKDTKCKKK